MSDDLNIFRVHKASVPTCFPRNGPGSGLTTLCAPFIVGFLLSGCALPLPIQIATWAIDGISYAATDKSILDHGISTVSNRDCAMFRIVTEEIVCRDTIADKVKQAFFLEDSLKAAEINVETFNGVVQLSGFINSQADINRAVVITQNVKGVKSVKNDLQLKYIAAEIDPDFPSRSPVSGALIWQARADGLKHDEH